MSEEIYESTHTAFEFANVDSYNIIMICRETIGDTDPYELLQKRKWFTFPGGRLYVRKDCLNHSFLTFLALKYNGKQH